ncbi:MAG: hypothetical protein ABR903_07385 [Thermodesulfovibrionales bacterium]
MKMLIVATALVMSIMAIYSCAKTANHETKLDTWLGTDVNDLIASWGPPSDEYTMPNGDKMYTWLIVGNTMILSNYTQYLHMTLTDSSTRWCKTTFTVHHFTYLDNHNEITDWQREGNACRSKGKPD